MGSRRKKIQCVNLDTLDMKGGNQGGNQGGNPDDRADICGEGQQGGKEIS